MKNKQKKCANCNKKNNELLYFKKKLYCFECIYNYILKDQDIIEYLLSWEYYNNFKMDIIDSLEVWYGDE